MFCFLDKSCVGLLPSDWTVLEGIRAVLNPFKEFTTFFSSSAPHVDEVLMSLHLLVSKLQTQSQSWVEGWNTAVQRCVEKLLKYLRKAFNNDWICMAHSKFPFHMVTSNEGSSSQSCLQSGGLHPPSKSLQCRISH